MEKVKSLFVPLMYRTFFIKTVILAILITLPVSILISKKPDTVSEAKYKAACKVIPAAELTNNPKVYIGRKVKITGEVVVFEETTDQKTDKKNTMLVIGVNDSSLVSSSGKLPVFISYVGVTSAFIKDTVTVYGSYFGNDTPKLKSIKDKNMPRINAKFIIIEPIKKK
jgi:hypothetical protein